MTKVGPTLRTDTANTSPAIETFNMMPEKTNRSDADLDIKAVEEIAKYGITWSQMSLFFYGVYRYTNLADAIAEAKRHPRRLN